VLSLANRGNHAPPSGALEGRRLAPREPRARSARQSAPVVANGLLLRQVAKLRENLLPGSDPAHGELVLPLRLADLEKRLRRREQPASLLKRSDALRKRGPPKLVDVPLNGAPAESRKEQLPRARLPTISPGKCRKRTVLHRTCSSTICCSISSRSAISLFSAVSALGSAPRTTASCHS
jgi:hypothetical protein